MNKISTILIASLLGFNAAHAAQTSATVYTTGENKQLIGQVDFIETPYGLLVSPNLVGLSAGLHGFHLHQHPDCNADGMGAGGHYDPANTNKHLGPYNGDGHLGDLPVLYVSDEGKANVPTLAPRLKLSDLKGLSVMIHANGDNYSDNPPLGGGGARIACGVIN